MKIFLDTNLILDVLAERTPFYDNSKKIWELVERRHLTGYLSTTMTDIFYILKSALSPLQASKKLLRREIRQGFPPGLWAGAGKWRFGDSIGRGLLVFS